MADWSPKYSHGLASLAGANTAQSPSKPEVELPQIGDTVRIVAQPYGHHVYVEGQEVRPEARIIELEVKAIKTAKVIFE